jgi:small-conductance mechanosensitive channel
VNTQKLLVAFSSILLPSVFVFGNAARSTFESLIFLFIVHPFDVGDRILVDGVSLLVEVYPSCFASLSLSHIDTQLLH